MDPAQYRVAYANYARSRPGYPTSPPFSHYVPLIEDCTNFAEDCVSNPKNLTIDSSPTVRYPTQIPTPKHFLSPSPPLEDLTYMMASFNDHFPSVIEGTTNDTVPISTAFHANSHPPPDTILSSSDGVLFYVHSPTLLEVSLDIFRPSPMSSLAELRFKGTIITVNAPSTDLNIVLHAVYRTSPAAHNPNLEMIVRAVDRMPAWSISPKDLLTPTTSLYILLLSHAPLQPLEVYALAAHHGLEDLAITVSPHLLSYDLSTITDETVERIGPVYLKKLLLLHINRSTALKAILLLPPHPHAPLKDCSFEDQKELTRAWALVSAHLAWDARPDLSTHGMETALNPLTEHITCKLCHQTLKEKIRDVVMKWAMVKVSGYKQL